MEKGESERKVERAVEGGEGGGQDGVTGEPAGDQSERVNRRRRLN